MPGIRIGRVVGVLMLLIFGFTVFQTLSEVIEKGSIQLFLGISSPDTYLDNNLGWLYPASQAMSELPSNARVLMLWEPRSFYCQPKCTADEVLDRWKHDLQVWHGPDAILTSWRKAGYTHLLYYKTGAQFLRESDNRYNPSDWTTLDKLLSSLKQPVDFGGAYLLYSLQ